jgi:hypothetical protein
MHLNCYYDAKFLISRSQGIHDEDVLREQTGSKTVFSGATAPKLQSLKNDQTGPEVGMTGLEKLTELSDSPRTALIATVLHN